MTPISMKEASNLTGIDYYTVAQARKRGLLSTITNISTPTVIKEQVEIFKGKKGFSHRLLTLEELALWRRYDEEATGKPISSPLTIEPIIDLEKVSDELTRMVLQKLSSVLSMSSEKTKVYL